MQNGSDGEHEGTAITSRRKPSEQAGNIYPAQENANFQADYGPTIEPSTAEGMDDKEFIVFAKNVRGLGNDDRLQELLEEIKCIDNKFDILVLNET